MLPHTQCQTTTGAMGFAAWQKRAHGRRCKGAPETPFFSFAGRVRVEMFDCAGRSVFGGIEQQVT